MMMLSEREILVDPDVAKDLGFSKLEMACYLYDFLDKNCTDNEVIKYIEILQGESYDNDFISCINIRFEVLRKTNTLKKDYYKVAKCLKEKDCKFDLYTALNAYLGEWDDDLQDRSTEFNDPNRQAG